MISISGRKQIRFYHLNFDIHNIHTNIFNFVVYCLLLCWCHKKSTGLGNIIFGIIWPFKLKMLQQCKNWKLILMLSNAPKSVLYFITHICYFPHFIALFSLSFKFNGLFIFKFHVEFYFITMISRNTLGIWIEVRTKKRIFTFKSSQ